MNSKRRFHLFYSARFIKYALILCVLPMLQAFIKFDWDSLMLAIQQDIIILLASLTLAVLVWLAASYEIGVSTITVYKGIFFRQTFIIPFCDIAVIEEIRPLGFRLFGASRVTLYFSSKSTMRKYPLIMTRASSQMLCSMIMPVKSDVSFYEPSGAERLSFVMLSANIVTSSAFAILTAQNITSILGEGPSEFAISSFTQLEMFLEHFLPAGLAFFAALFFLIFSIAILYSIFRTAGFTVCRNGGVMISRGGLLTKIERRILCCEIVSCDVRITPAARLLRRYPVFVCAGSYHGSDIPVFAFKKNERERLSALLPEFILTSPAYKPPYKRNIFQFIWPALSVLGLTAILAIAFYFNLPNAFSVLLIPLVLGAAALLNAIDGFGREGFTRQANRTLSVVYTRYFTRHEVCIFTFDVAMKIWRTPLYFLDKRCDVYIALPYRRRLRIRGLQIDMANSFSLLI